jgi:uncharacterized membrane protein YfcA
MGGHEAVAVTAVEWLAILAAGVAAGGINALVGSGTLVTFSTLVTLGVPPLTANVSNTVGLVAGSVAGSLGYRSELAQQRDRLVRYVPVSLAGGLAGAALLLVLPSSAFDAVVPVLVALGVLLVAIQPYLSRRLAVSHDAHPVGGPVAWVAVFAVGVYGGYFGAAQGILLIAVLGILVDAHLHRMNALKNVLVALVNGIAAAVFIVLAPVDWGIALVLLVGSSVGGYLAGRHGRNVSPAVLRTFIIVVGVIALVVMLT